jgi:hypothetical protein
MFMRKKRVNFNKLTPAQEGLKQAVLEMNEMRRGKAPKETWRGAFDRIYKEAGIGNDNN